MTIKEDGPDQARSWAIAMAGCVINSLLSGISRATGLFYVSLIETYGISRMEANMPFTFRNVVRNLASPVAGAIGQRYGARDITFAGGIFACLGISMCFFAPSVIWITIMWGGMHGIGVALGNTLFPVIVNQYFLKYRATASGLSLSGACFGSLAFPFIVEYLLRNFGLSGTFLITGSFVLHVLPAALLMTEPSWIKRNSKIKQTSRKEIQRFKTLPPVQGLEKIREGVVETSEKNINIISSSGGENKAGNDDAIEVLTRTARVFSRNGVDNAAFVGSKTDISERNVEMVEEEVQEIRMRTISIAESSLVLPNPLASDVQETSLIKGITILIFNPMFHVISISLAGFAMCFDPYITVIVDYAIDKGLKENDANYFISMMSLGDLLGRLCFGWVTDKKYMTLSKFMMLLQVIQGICFLLLPLFTDFVILIAVIMIYGLASGATLVMYPLLVSKYLATVQSLAIGSIAVFTGVMSFSVPPLIGYFRDNAGSYDGMFIISGSISLVTGCLWLFEPLFVRLKKSHRSASTAVNS